MIKSALMTSSLQSVLDTNGSSLADPWDRGAGSIRANRAVTPSVTFSVSATAYYKSATDPLHRVDLNTPSINVNPLAGAIKTTRTVKNVTNQTETFSGPPADQWRHDDLGEARARSRWPRTPSRR